MGQAVVDRSPPRTTASYTSFSPRLGPSFIATGGLLAIAGGLGSWVRVTSIDPTGIAHQTSSLSGSGTTTGWLVATLGLVAVAATFIRFPGSRWLRLAVSAAAVSLIALRLSDLSSLASAMAFRAGARAGTAFTAYHAGFGWGAWVMTLALVSLALGTIVTSLRWLDERKGLAS
jgi:hypothetical protein